MSEGQIELELGAAEDAALSVSKMCAMCGEVKPRTDFHKRPRVRDGLQYRCKTCISEYERRRKDERVRENPAGYKAYQLNDASKRRAKAKGLTFDLTVEWIERQLRLTSHCPILGIPLVIHTDIQTGRYQDQNSASLDRIDNTKGYTKDNVWVISWRANKLKGDATLDELKALYEATVFATQMQQQCDK